MTPQNADGPSFYCGEGRSENLPSAVHHPMFGRVYAWLSRPMERELGEHRRKLLAALSGSVVEIGAGNGMNFAHYPPAVDYVLAIEPDPYLRRLAQAAAHDARSRIDVVDAVAESIPAEDERFDAAVACSVLCSVADPRRALAEIRRVLPDDGQLRFLEHVAAESSLLGHTQRILDATVWPRIAGGCHLNRDTVAAIRSAGFAVLHVEPFRFPDIKLNTPMSHYVRGVAVRPS